MPSKFYTVGKASLTLLGNARKRREVQFVTMRAEMRRELAVLNLLLLLTGTLVAKGSVISKSSKEECIVENDVKNKNSSVCRSKLVVSLTVTANEVAIMPVTASY